MGWSAGGAGAFKATNFGGGGGGGGYRGGGGGSGATFGTPGGGGSSWITTDPAVISGAYAVGAAGGTSSVAGSGGSVSLECTASGGAASSTPSPSPTRSLSPTSSRSPLPPSATPSPSPTPSLTPSKSPTPSATPSRSGTPSRSRSPSATRSTSGTPSRSPTPSASPTRSTSPSRSPTPSRSGGLSAPPTPSRSPSAPPTPTRTRSPSPSPTPSKSPTASKSPSAPATPTASPSRSPSPTRSGVLSPTPTPSLTPSPCPAPPGSYCAAGGAVLPCPVGAYCAGGGARNASCYPAAACPAPGLAAQPPCLWSSFTLAGSATAGNADGTGAAATLTNVRAVASDATGNAYVTDRTSCRLRRVTPAGVVTSIAGGGATGSQCGSADGIGSAALFGGPWGVSVGLSGSLFIVEHGNCKLRGVTPTGVVTTIAGGGASGTQCGNADGVGTAALFNLPNFVAASKIDPTLAWIADSDNYIVRRAPAGLATTTLNPPAGQSYTTGISVDAADTMYVSDMGGRILKLFPNVTFSVLGGGGMNTPRGNALWAPDSVIVAETGRNRVVQVTPLGTTVLAGGGASGFAGGAADGYGTAALFTDVWGVAVTPTGAIYVAAGGTVLRQLTCAPCPAGSFCAGGGAPAPCPAGTACPLGSTAPAPCPAGSAAGAGAANCTLCAPGSHAPAPGAAACAPCPGGHFCPLGTASTALLTCGVGNFCPDASAAPRACPLQVPPAGGWGAQGVQGPAFVVETAHCLNHCFFNFSAGADGLLSRC